MTTLRIHRDTYPWTDHGYTWVECIWYEHDGERVSPIIPAAGYCERLGNMPGGPVPSPDWAYEESRYGKPERTVGTQTVHDDGYYRVGTVSITGPERRTA